MGIWKLKGDAAHSPGLRDYSWHTSGDIIPLPPAMEPAHSQVLYLTSQDSFHTGTIFLMSTLNLPCWNLSPLFLIWSITGTQNVSFPSPKQPFRYLSIYNSNLPLTQELQFLPSLQGFFPRSLPIPVAFLCFFQVVPSEGTVPPTGMFRGLIPHVPREVVLPLSLSDCSLFNTSIKFSSWPNRFLQHETHTPVFGYRAALAKIKKLSNLFISYPITHLWHHYSIP